MAVNGDLDRRRGERARGERDVPRTRRPASGATRSRREEKGVDVDVDAAESLVVAESAESRPLLSVPYVGTCSCPCYYLAS